MSGLLDRIKAILTITGLSFQPIVLAIVFMSIAWNVPLPLNHYLKIVTTLFSGIFGFAIGTITFWKTTQKLMKQKR